jgi:hypothetical protein
MPSEAFCGGRAWIGVGVLLLLLLLLSKTQQWAPRADREWRQVPAQWRIARIADS